MEPNAGEREVLPVAQPDVAVAEEVVTPVDDLGAGDASELGRAEDEVLLAVCLDDVLDGQLVLAGDAQVLVNVATRVDDGCLPFVANHVGRVGDAGSLDALEEHE